jgi:hypothetical protein
LETYGTRVTESSVSKARTSPKHLHGRQQTILTPYSYTHCTRLAVYLSASPLSAVVFILLH